MRLLSVYMAGFIASIFLLPAVARAEQISHIGLDQKVLVICVKTSGATTTRRTAASWVSILNSQINPQIRLASYNQTSYQFQRPVGTGAPADGWFQLSYPIEDWPGTLQGAIDAVKLADPYVNMANFNRVTVIINTPNFGGQTVGWQWVPVHEGIESYQIIGGVSTGCRLMSVSAENEWQKDSFWPYALGNTRDEAASVVAHEMGHHLNLPTHYGDVTWSPQMTRDSITPWDIMGLSPNWNEYLGWAKFERGWLPNTSVTTVGPPLGATDIDTTVGISPIHTTSGTRLIRIPFANSVPFVGYCVELRQNDATYTNRDAFGNVLQQGALVTLVNENPEIWYGNKAIVMENPAFPADNSRATLRPGDTFTDSARGITITCMGLSSASAAGSVKIHYTHPPINFNPYITPWGNPPYETSDIWVDSEKNGWGTYRYHDGVGNPVGNGDPAWVRQLPDGSWRRNRVWVQIHNSGPDPMSNVRVQVYVNDPPGMGDTGASWAGLGALIFPTVPGYGTVKDYVWWAPQVAAHTCLRAVIETYPNETNVADNTAQENVSMFETTASSPYQAVTLAAMTGNPLSKSAQVMYQVTGIPLGMKWKVEPRSDILPEHGSNPVKLTLYPPDPRVQQRYKQGQVLQPKITALMLFGDAWMPVGGIEMWTHLVYKSSISITGMNTPKGITAIGTLIGTQPSIVPLGERTVAVSLIPNRAERADPITVVVRTDAKGNYKASFQKLQPGLYILNASFGGDDLYKSCDSRDAAMAW